MRQIQCVQCGRPLLAGEAAAVICPSCGHAAIVPAETLSAAFSAADDSETRPVPPEIVAAATAVAAQPAQPEQPTLPPPPPPDARTMPVYDPPSLPRSHAASSAEAPSAPAAPAPAPEATPTALAASSSSPAQDATRDLPPELLARATADPATRPVSGPPPVDEAVVAAARRRRERLTALSGVIMLVVLAVGSAGAVMAANGTLASLLNIGRPTPTATAVRATPTPAVPAGFKAYTAQDASFQLDVPATWVPVPVSSNNSTVAWFADPVTSANVMIQSVQASLDPQTMDGQFLSGQANTMASASHGSASVKVASVDTLLLANATWTRETADITITSAGTTTSWHLVVLAAQHGQRTYLVAYFAPSAAFPTADSTSFQPMLQTLVLAQ